MDAIRLLRDDHRTVKALFREFERAKKRDEDGRGRLVEKILAELTIHAFVEEQAFYPAVRSEVDGSDETILESLEEHHVMKRTIEELAATDESDERYDARVTVLMELVRHHVEEEEQDLFPEVRESMGRKRLAEIGEQLEQARTRAPRSPRAESALARR